MSSAIDAAKAAQQQQTQQDYVTVINVGGHYDPTNSTSITVDASQIPKINSVTWTVTKDATAGVFFTSPDGLLLENFILGVPATATVIHRNGNRTHYQVSNLEVVG